MKKLTVTEAVGVLYSLVDEACDSNAPVQITGKRGGAVLISEEEWLAVSKKANQWDIGN